MYVCIYIYIYIPVYVYYISLVIAKVFLLIDYQVP